MKLLVVTPEPVDADMLRSTLGEEVEGAEVLVVSPATNRSKLAFWVSDPDEARATAGTIAELVAERRPDELTTAWRKEKRGGRVLVDVARNTYAQTTVAPYAVRALPGAPVATPLAWEELDDPELHPRRWTLASVPQRLSERGDPWARIGASAGTLRSPDGGRADQ